MAGRSELAFGYDLRLCRLPAARLPRAVGRLAQVDEWEDNTISYNTVVVNELPQATVRVGHPEFFAQFPDFGGFCVDSREVYGIQTYRRTMALMPVGGNASYALDVFHVQGGKDHLLSFHALPGSVTATGLRLIRQEGGSYAGADVPYGTSQRGARMGYSWLDNVERDAAPPESFVLDYQGTPLLEPEGGRRPARALPRLQLLDDVALADGHVPVRPARRRLEDASLPARAPRRRRGPCLHLRGARGAVQGRALIRKATRLKVTPSARAWRGPEGGTGGRHHRLLGVRAG